MAVRRRRTAGPARVGVTGAATGLGRALLERLAGRDELDLLVGIDVAGRPAAGAQWRTADVRDPLLAERLAGLTTVVHLATTFAPELEPAERRARNVRGTASVLAAARSAGVRRVVVVTSVDVLGAVPGTPVPAPEGTPVLAPADGSPTGDLVEVERLADHATRTGLDVVVLRPAALVGGPPESYAGGLLAGLASPRLLALRGTEPLWQLCHVDDLLAALELAALGRLSGAVPVACEGWLTQARVEVLAGRRRLELPAAVARSTAERLHRLGATPGSPHELDALLAPVVVDADRLRAAGWVPAWTNEEALQAHLLALPPHDRRTATYTAAGATVAVVGTAALVRRARRRRGR